MKLNKPKNITTYEGGKASYIKLKEQLKRAVMSCMLWENNFYEDGISIAQRIKELIYIVDNNDIIDIIIEAKEKFKLRHVPLYLLACLAEKTQKKGIIKSNLVERIITRPDDMGELLSLLWIDGKRPIPAAFKKGIAKAFLKFDEYQLAKWDRKANVRLRDIMLLTRPKPQNDEQSDIFKRLLESKLKTPLTWETQLSVCKNDDEKKIAWLNLINQKKLSGLAFLMNIRNILKVGIDKEIINSYMDIINVSKLLPFQFLKSAQHNLEVESIIERGLFRLLKEKEKLSGNTILLVDVSGSMEGRNMDYMCSLSILLRELTECIYIFSFSNKTVKIPDRHGFALSDAIINSQYHNGTYISDAIKYINDNYNYDRIIIITDEQIADYLSNPKCKHAYIINVAQYKKGINYQAYNHINGISENVINFITEFERFGKEKLL